MPKIFALRHQLAEQQAKLKQQSKGENQPVIDDVDQNSSSPSHSDTVPVIPYHYGPPLASHSGLLTHKPDLGFPSSLLDHVTITPTPAIRTLASRKAYDEPMDVVIRRKDSDRYHPYNRSSVLGGNLSEPIQDRPINLQIHKTTVSPPPQSEPVDFSTKKESKQDAKSTEHPARVDKKPMSFTSSRELRFSKNLKFLLVEIFRSHPEKARMIIDYIQHVSRKKDPNNEPKTEAAPERYAGTSSDSETEVTVKEETMDGNERGPKTASPGPGKAHSGGIEGPGSSPGSSSGGSDYSENNNNNNNHHSLNNNNNNFSKKLHGKGGFNPNAPGMNTSSADINIETLDFGDLPESSTAKWFSEHPDINPAKVFDGINLKSEFPYPTDTKVEKPPDLTNLDNATANLLQMSVPDPSTTFLDIGTDSSMYEDDPFNIEHLLPSTFNMNQLDMGPNATEQAMLAHGAENSVNLALPSGKPIHLQPNHPHHNMIPPHSQISASQHTNNSLKSSHHFSLHSHHSHHHHLPPPSLPPTATSIGLSLYPETTIRPVIAPPSSMGSHHPHHSHGANQLPANIRSLIKTEPMPCIKREDPYGHDPLSLDAGYDRTSGMSPMSSMESVGSPGSPPTSTMAMFASQHSRIPLPGSSGSMGGGKMQASHIAALSRKKAVGQEDEDLINIPSLQVRIKILQQRLGLTAETPVEIINGGHGIKNPLASDAPETIKLEKLPAVRPDNDPSKFQCRICSKVFKLQRLLNRHMKCHSDVKRYLCTFCGKGFNDTFDLKRHTRTHTGVRPYKCNLCEKSFTQRCSLESHCLKVHGVAHNYEYKQRRSKMYVCEDCGFTTKEPELHYLHLKEKHPYSPALLKFYDKRHFKFNNSGFASMLLQVNS
ncbi:uncharacterized protein LOC131878075 isoform X2 [Tigriopus californicus]|nr:uncharacterized protein LOC131878075 isoform X2 [Tigriopus californicus]